LPSATAGAPFPIGKVPVIVHDTASGSHVISETPAICAYLADIHPETALGPHDEERAAYYRWLLFAAGPVEQAFLFSALKLPVPDDPQQQGVLGFGSFERVSDMLETHLGANQYVCGDRFTMADLYLGSQLGWGMQFGAFERRPAFAEYVDRCFARPAHQRASAIDDALIEEQG
jgi:glutathione S-transferase